MSWISRKLSENVGRFPDFLRKKRRRSVSAPPPGQHSAAAAVVVAAAVVAGARAAAVVAEGAVATPDHHDDDQDDNPPPAIAERAETGTVVTHKKGTSLINFGAVTAHSMLCRGVELVPFHDA